MGGELRELSLRSGVLALLATEPNIVLDAVQLQRAMFLLAVSDPAQQSSTYGFSPTAHGPVSTDLYMVISELCAMRCIYALAAEFPTYIASSRGWRQGQSVRNGQEPDVVTKLDAIVDLTTRTDFISLGEVLRASAPEFFLETEAADV
jgi:hypothetical protein